MKICPNCTEKFELLSKDGFCFNCQSAYEIGVKMKNYNPYTIAISIVAGICVVILALGIILFISFTRGDFIVTRDNTQKSEALYPEIGQYEITPPKAGDPCFGGLTENAHGDQMYCSEYGMYVHSD
jgi:hypothetical protein